MIFTKVRLHFLFLILAFSQTLYAAPKYPDNVHTLRTEHHYIQQHATPTYWRLSPYYIGQRNESSCSLASATVLVNTLRNMDPKLANLDLATQDQLIEKVQNKIWSKGVEPQGDGIGLDQLAQYFPEALKVYELPPLTIKAIHAENNLSTAQQLHQALLDMEAGKTLMIVNFDHSYFTNSEPIGHFSPLAAYDEKNKAVLVMDVYRYIYEPYWVPEELLLQAMATRDSSSTKNRGYLVVGIQ